jgi:molybdopterin-containing oxidoreductase family membrane subunit
MCKVMMATGMMVAISYCHEFFIAWYSGNEFEAFTFLNRCFGPFWWVWGLMFWGNVLVPQFFWSKWIKDHNIAIWILCIFVNIGMWGERFAIISVSLSRSFLPSNWSYYHPTRYDIGLFCGTIGMFLMFFLLFFRFMPVVAMSEVKAASPEAHAGHGGKGGH